MLTVGSLFAGIGGLELGLERAGMEVRWQVENDPYCIRVLEKHWPHVRRHTDIETFLPADAHHAGKPDVPIHDETRNGMQESRATAGARAWWAVDLICGGFPCQPVSVAGTQGGDADGRWLWPEMRRVCEVVRPRWVLVENVPGLLSASTGRLFGGVVRDLAALGYVVEWDCISAANVGANHIRDRVFIVARLANTDTSRRDGRPRQLWPGRGRELADGDWWATEPNVGRVDTRVPARVDRLRCLGNSVVPAVAELIGRMIVDADRN